MKLKIRPVFRWHMIQKEELWCFENNLFAFTVEYKKSGVDSFVLLFDLGHYWQFVSCFSPFIDHFDEKENIIKSMNTHLKERLKDKIN